MSFRQLGGGRILGSGRSLAPPALPTHSSLLSPSNSPVSLPSENSDSLLASSPLPDHAQDISSKVSLENGGPSATTTSSRLICPICEEEMMTLLQLNRHLDDDHQELPAVEQVEVKNWFEKQVVKAKNFQPLAVINQKLKQLDVFESNDTLVTQHPNTQSVNRSSPSEPMRQLDPDEVVTRTHWQRPDYNDLCTEPSCGKKLGAISGSVNCRKCGLLFCEDHTMYQMKLSRSAQHEPVRGFWCRVCETCYKSREGYNDRNGAVRDYTSFFLGMRRKTMDKQYLEISRLEKRLTKLTSLLASVTEDVSSGGTLTTPVATLTSQKSQRKVLEQSIVTWEDDSSVTKCPFCHQEFSAWTFRRHHCRVCGRVVCADPRTNCSSDVGLNIEAKKSIGGLHLDIRMCRNCNTTVFSRRDFEEELSKKAPDQKSYEILIEYEKGIKLSLTNFQRSLLSLQDPDKPPSHVQLAEASRVRKRLIDSFGKYDILAKRIRDLPTSSPTQMKLQKAIYQQASSFLHLYMLPLKSLPKVLKHASPHGINGQNGSSRHGDTLAAIKFNDVDSASQISSSSALSAMEAEEKQLRERLIVLEEQKFFVSEMMADANKRRRFDEVSSLSTNMDDLKGEIDQVNSTLAQLDFAGVYGQMGYIKQ